MRQMVTEQLERMKAKIPCLYSRDELKHIVAERSKAVIKLLPSVK